MLSLQFINEIYRQANKYDTETVFHVLRNQEVYDISICFFNNAVVTNPHDIIVIPEYVFQHLSRESYTMLDEHFLSIGIFIRDSGGYHIDAD